MLRIAGYRDEALDRSADALCTALQLTNFWQDVGRDWERDRLYVPLEDVGACQAEVRDLADRNLTDAWRCALQRVARRTRELFRGGRAVCDGVGGRLRCELRITWLGGVRILDRLERNNFDVFASRPELTMADVPSLLWNALTWRAR